MPESNRDEIAKLEALYATNPAGRVFTHLAEAYRKAGEYDRARAILEQGLEKHPTYASAHVVLGRVLMDLNKSDDAVEAFRRVLQLDPHNLVALRSLGDLARAAGRNAEAMGYFEELRHQDPSNEEISAIIAELLASPDFHAAEPPEPLPELPEPEVASPSAVEATTREITSPEAQLEEMMAGAVMQPEIGAPVEEDATLPGDLADFARHAAPAEDYGTVHLEDTPPADTSEATDRSPYAPPAEAEPFTEPARETVPEPAAIEAHDALAAQADVSHEQTEAEVTAEPVPEPEFTAADVAYTAPEEPAESLVEPATDEPGLVANESEFTAQPFGEPPVADVPPAELPIDLGPSDLDVEVPPEETFQSIDFSEFEAASEEPAVEEQATAETILESVPGDIEPETEPVAVFEPAPELTEQAPVVFEPVAEVFEPPPESFEPAPSEAPEPLETFQPSAMEASATPPSAEVVTETMAELYRSQGLHDRAAEVYRALLQERPGDANLEAKLREVETATISTSPATGVERGESPATSAPEDEIESPWTSFNPAAASEPSLYAWEENAQADDDAGRPVSEYFQALLSWRPTNTAPTSYPEPVSETVETDYFDLGQPIDTAEEPLFEEPVTPTESSPPPFAAGEGMPWDEPGIPGSPQETGGDDFDDWFKDEPPAEEAEPQQPAAEAPPPVAAEAADSDEEDDDLEMFRSWLQSLKK